MNYYSSASAGILTNNYAPFIGNITDLTVTELLNGLLYEIHSGLLVLFSTSPVLSLNFIDYKEPTGFLGQDWSKLDTMPKENPC